MELKEMFTFETLVTKVQDAIIDWENPFDLKPKYDVLARKAEGGRADMIIMSYSQFEFLEKYLKV